MKHLKKWTIEEANKLFLVPFFDLLYQAQKIHRNFFNPQQIQISALLSIKTGLCPEDCKYCAQSSHNKTGIKSEKLIEISKIINEAKKAKLSGVTRFCMGAAWRNPKERDIPYLKEIIKEVKSLGLETCMTLGMLNRSQAMILSEAGLDYYNHNIDSSREYYSNITTTRTYQDRLETIKNVREAGIKVCSGGIVGLGEKVIDRAAMLVELSNLPKPPESVPINMLMKIKGTPMVKNEEIDHFDFVRTIAVARIMMPSSYIRLSAGREYMNEQTQALCFMAGANSVFYGCKLLTSPNYDKDKDLLLFKKLNIKYEFNTVDKTNIDLQDSELNKSLSNINNLKFYNAEN